MPARHCLCLVAILAAVPPVRAAQSSQEPTIEAVLACAGEYVMRYQRDFAGIVAQETMIRTGGGQDLPAHGRFWIEPGTGRVLVSTLNAGNRNVSSEIDVTYGHEPALGVLVPREMRESYEQTDDGAAVTAVATYSNFRQFQVKVDEKIAPIK
jgi:hypothetical protein